MLAKLPPELFDMVAKSLASKNDLRSLSLVSRTIHHAVQKTLWTSLDLSPIKEDELWRFKSKPVLDKNLPMFRWPTELNFDSPFNQIEGERCPHCHDIENLETNVSYRGGERGEQNSRFGCLSRAAESIVDILPAHRLQKFTWGLGACMPDSLLGRHGILARQQPQLRSLSLTTAGDCMQWTGTDLSPFRHLQSFCWRGPRVDDLCYAVDAAIQNNRTSLTHLELDFVDWPRLRDKLNPLVDDELNVIPGWDADFFGTQILCMDKVLPERPLFSAMVSLSLSSVPLTGFEAHAFDFRALRSLTLRKCPGLHLFLAETNRLTFKSPLRLKTFEIHHLASRDQEVSTAEHDALLGLIGSFEGLHELFLSLPRPIDTLALWNKVVKQHGATLKRFVHHQRSLERKPGTMSMVDEDTDIPDFDLGPKLRLLNKENPLRHLDCAESIGISCLPEILGPMFASFTQKATTSSLQLIHIRQSRLGRGQWGSWVTRGAFYPVILQPIDPRDFDPESAGPPHRSWSLLNTTRYATRGIDDAEPQGLPEVGSEEEARRMESQTPEDILSPSNKLRKPVLLPLEKQAILRGPLRRFANWVFGPRGLPALQVIALGDFAHGRVPKKRDNMFLVRGNSGASTTDDADNYSIFWPEEKGLQDWAELVDRNKHFLEACPAEPLMDYDLV